MSKLFIDNIGKVKIYDKGVFMPGSLRVTMSTQESGPLSEVGGKLSVFVSSVSNSRESKIELKQNLLTEYYLVPFGEAPSNLTVSGVVFASSQVDTTVNGYLGAYSRLMKSALAKPVPKQAQPKSNTPGWITKGATSLTKGATNLVTGVLGLPGLSGAIKAAGALVNGTVSLLNQVASLPSTILNTIKSELGMSAGESIEPAPLTDEDLTPLSLQQLHRVFDLIHAGAISNKQAVEVQISYGGVSFSGYLIGLKVDPLKDGMGFTFVMNFVCTEPPTYITEDIYDNVKTRGKSSQIFDALFEAGISAVRPISGSGAVNIGRVVA